jgi:hypothetical protein
MSHNSTPGGGGGYGGGGGGYGGGGYGGGGGGFGGRGDLDTIQLSRPDFSNLPVFEKNFYFEHPAVTVRGPEAPPAVASGVWATPSTAYCHNVYGSPFGLVVAAIRACGPLDPHLATRKYCRQQCCRNRRSSLCRSPPRINPLKARSEGEIEAYRVKRSIHVYGEGVPKPVETFEEASFPGGCLG